MDFIEILSKSALPDLLKANEEVVKLISNIDKAGTSLKGMKTPSGSDSAIQKLTADYDNLAKANQKIQKELLKEQQERKKTVQGILDQSKSYQSLAKQKQQSITQSEKEAVLLAKANNLYNQTQSKVTQLSQAYNNLAIKKELGAKLTAKEEFTLHKLTSELNIYQTALKKVDADIQKHNRNVGNYASGFNGLGNSINQLTREAPAFTVSLNTGFLALSNNLPILFDEISRVKQANKELIAQGQPVKSTFMQLAGAVLSWGTALSLGVTLLTLYGGKIIDSILGSEKKKKALEAEKKAIEDKVEAERQQNEAIGQSIASEQNRARILFEIARNEEVSSKKRNEALQELRSRYGTYLKDLTDQQILAGKTADAEERLNQALIGRGYALATQNLLEKNATAQMALQVEYQKTIAKNIERINATRNDNGSIKNINQYNKALRETAKSSNSAMNALEEKLKPLKEEEATLLSLFRSNAKYLDVVNETSDTKKKVAKEEEQYNKNSKNAFEANIKALEQTLNNLDRFSPAYDTINGLLILQKGLYEQLFGTIKKGQEEVQEGIMLTDEQVYEEYFTWLKLKEATNDYIKLLASGQLERSLSSIGLSSAKMFLDFDENGQSTFDKLIEGADTVKEKFAINFQAIGDVVQDTFNKITELSNANFQNEYSNLEQQRDIALLFAGESESGRAEIQRQYEAERRAIQRREFKAKKQMALFNIAIDTAQGIVSALASTPPNVPLSIAIGVIGALQAGIVASQQVPAFWKGTDNAPEGWALTQERGAEMITDSKGKIKSMGSDKGARLTYLKKGDKVKTASQTMDYLMFNNDLNNILTGNNISSPNINVNGLSSEEYRAGISDLKSAIGNKPSFEFNMDARGNKLYRKEQGQKIEMISARQNIKTIDV